MSAHIKFVRDDARYVTRLGAACLGDASSLLGKLPDAQVNLIVTAPPCGLLRHSGYSQRKQREWIDELAHIARLAQRKLCTDGSLVLALRGGYQRDAPVRSLCQLRLPLRLCDELGFFLAEESYWNNPSKRPGSSAWVTKHGTRAKDSVTTFWWFGKTKAPKANVPRAQDAALSTLLSTPNVEASPLYARGCKGMGLRPQPTCFPSGLSELFIKRLTQPGDLVVDIFGGSNVTGRAAEQLGRRWLSFEKNPQYVATSIFRFMPDRCSDADLRRTYTQAFDGDCVRVADCWMQHGLHR